MASDISVLSGGAMRRFMVEAVPLFEAASGTTVALRFGRTRTLKAEIEAGAAFDVALLPRWAIDALVAARRMTGAPVDVVRSLVGLVVGADAPKPDIATAAALKGVLQAAKAISYSKGPSGEHVAELLKRLGLAAEMADKTVFAVGRTVAEVVAAGEAEIGMQQIIEILPVAGAALVGPLPGELTNYVLYSAGLCPETTSGEAARAFVKFLKSAAAAQIIRANGMEPG
jgi:molybdate transport system substrate-binding protein